MTTIHRVTIGAAAILLIAGCKKTTDNSSNYKSAIDAYYNQSPSCLWSHPQQFPMQVAPSDTDKTAPLAALVDAGLLTRSTSEKKIIIVSKRETNYDLTDKGRSDWTADPNQPGYGNFCYGHRSVSSIESSTPNNGQPGATTTVTYHYSFSSVPDWAKNPELQNAVPQLKTDVSGSGNGTATASLTDTPSGWQVQGAPPANATTSTGSNNSQPATSADGKIVQ